MAATEQDRLEEDQLERDLAELTSEFAAWLGWDKPAETQKRNPQ
jgi:hypothetical protein